MTQEILRLERGATFEDLALMVKEASKGVKPVKIICEDSSLPVRVCNMGKMGPPYENLKFADVIFEAFKKVELPTGILRVGANPTVFPGEPYSTYLIYIPAKYVPDEQDQYSSF